MERHLYPGRNGDPRRAGGNIFSKATADLGIGGNALMLVYFALVTFVPGADKSALALAMPGGLLIMVWMVLFALRLFRLAGSPNGG